MTSQPHAGITVADLLTRLQKVAGTHAVLHGSGREVLTDVSHSSADAAPGVLYAARPGATVDGHDFAAQSVASGSPALLVERVLPDLSVDQIVVDSVARAMGYAAAAVHHDPSNHIDVLGITGTNGKTTTAYLLDAIWRQAGRRTGLIGTVEARIGDARVAGVRTTPESTDLQRLFARMVGEEVTAASIEVSSHGLTLGRLNGVRFRAALFTNLTQDHLDFHTSMSAYFQAKALLFTPAFVDAAVITVDDVWGVRMADAARSAGTPTWTLSRDPMAGADITATDVQTDADGARFTAVVRGHRVAVRIAIPGDYNVTNALGAIATAHGAGVALDVAAAGVGTIPGVPGRMERVDAGQPFTVLVDYAHTPEAVSNVLASARAVTDGRLIVVLGCGGDRDRAKRPLMAQAAASGADLAVLTSDNPRSEQPDAILDDMAAGLPMADPDAVWRITDRAEAIGRALDAATPGDVVIIAGKGHETYQELADGRVDFDDRRVAAAHLTVGGTP